MYFNILLFSSILLITLDSIHLFVLQNRFSKMITDIQKEPFQLKFIPFLISYIPIIIAFNYFIIHKKASTWEAFLLGLIIYGQLELTNYAFFNNWEVLPIFTDSLWGGFSFALINYLLKNPFKNFIKLL